jgi:hypothetical protein
LRARGGQQDDRTTESTRDPAAWLHDDDDYDDNDDVNDDRVSSPRPPGSSHIVYRLAIKKYLLECWQRKGRCSAQGR